MQAKSIAVAFCLPKINRDVKTYYAFVNLNGQVQLQYHLLEDLLMLE